jgi:large subunit ribosomal protein L9
LFGSVGTRDIAEAITAAGQPVEKSEVLLPAGALREIGEYTVALALGSEVTAEVKLQIVVAK